MKEYLIIAISVFIIILFGIYHLNIKSNLETEVSFLNAKINQKNKQINYLQKDVENLQEENVEISQELNEVKIEAYNTLKELESFQLQIKNSLEWFSLNNNINQYDEYRSFEKDLERDCVKTGDKCEVKLSCLSFINDENDFTYLNDTEDELSSLVEMYEKEGGDCEDYSLLAVAELNYIKEYCKDEEMNETVYTAWVEDNNRKHFVEWNEEYYIKDAEDYNFYLPYYYAVCGDFNGGHCVIAFSKYPLNDTENSINNAILIEPQTGEVVIDFRREENDFIFLAFYNDMYLKQNEWKSYSDFNNRIIELSDNLKNLIEIREE